MDDESSHSTVSNSTKRPCARALEGALPVRGARTDSQMEIDISQDNAAFRDRYRCIPHTVRTSASTGLYASSPVDIENAFLNRAPGWPAYEVLFSVGNPHLVPEIPLSCSSPQGVPSHRVFVRDANDPVSFALGPTVRRECPRGPPGC